nr:protein THEM6 [Loxodonta africana]
MTKKVYGASLWLRPELAACALGPSPYGESRNLGQESAVASAPVQTRGHTWGRTRVLQGGGASHQPPGTSQAPRRAALSQPLQRRARPPDAAVALDQALYARCIRSLRLLEPLEVRTRLLAWDDSAFFLEARFVSLRDGFVCALLRFRQHMLGTSPERVVQHLCKRRVESPELPLDLQHWIAYNEASSQLLRAESGLSSAAKDQ